MAQEGLCDHSLSALWSFDAPESKGRGAFARRAAFHPVTPARPGASRPDVKFYYSSSGLISPLHPKKNTGASRSPNSYASASASYRRHPLPWQRVRFTLETVGAAQDVVVLRPLVVL